MVAAVLGLLSVTVAYLCLQRYLSRPVERATKGWRPADGGSGSRRHRPTDGPETPWLD